MSPAVSVIEELMPPGTSEKQHFHATLGQFLYVIAGRLTIEVEGLESEVGHFEGLHIAAKKFHCVRNVSTSDARFLLITSQPARSGQILCPDA